VCFFFVFSFLKMNEKEVIVLEVLDGGKEESGIISILKETLKNQAEEQEGKEPLLIRYNDLSTADLIVRLMPDGPILSLNKSIVQENPFFAAFRNFAEANGYAEITAPDPETCAFVIETLYFYSTNQLVFKTDKVIFQQCVDLVVKHKFVGVLRNASFFMMDALLSRCYLLYVSFLNLTFLGFLKSGIRS
jgi:hypothetical protein